MTTNSDIQPERIEFQSNQTLMKGKVYVPADLTQCKGVVIFTHGLGYTERQYKISGSYFAQNGYLMMTYNLRGHAGTAGEWTLEASVRDLIEGINVLNTKYQFKNNQKICVIGHSTGALIALLASFRDRRIKFASLVTIVTCLRDSFFYWFKSGFNKEANDYFKFKGVVPEIISNFMADLSWTDKYMANQIPEEQLNVPHRYGLLKSSSWGKFFHEIIYTDNVLHRIDEINIPLLLFRGEYDEIMDVEKTHELYEKVSGKVPCKLYVTDSQNHFHNDKWDMIQQETLKFFDEFCDYHDSGENYKHRSILIVDDEELVVKTLANLLSKNGYTNVSVCSNGEAAIKLVRERQEKNCDNFDFIISDIRMPGIDGIETVKRMKSIMGGRSKQDRPVLFITGYEGKRTQEEARAVGYVDYMYKPLDVDRFLNCIEKQLKT